MLKPTWVTTVKHEPREHPRGLWERKEFSGQAHQKGPATGTPEAKLLIGERALGT